MKSLAISVKKRENVGKSNSKALRNLRKLVYTPDVFLVDLDVEGTKTSCILQDIQFHPVTDKILHIDFLEVFADKEVTVEIPVVLTGMAIGVRNGGNLLTRRNKIITRAIPGNLPDAIEIDISELKIGMFIYIKDLKSDKYSFLASDNSVVVGVKTARAAIEEEVAEVEEGEEGEEGTPSEASGDQSTDIAKEGK
jgi:large subunit ribosomal protein L25